MNKITQLILITTFLITPLVAMAQTIEKTSDKEYTKTNVTTINIAEKQNECNAISAQTNALIARLDECKLELSTVEKSEVGKPVIIDVNAEDTP